MICRGFCDWPEDHEECGVGTATCCRVEQPEMIGATGSTGGQATEADRALGSRYSVLSSVAKYTKRMNSLKCSGHLANSLGSSLGGTGALYMQQLTCPVLDK
jgi:hypothetical protein